MSERSREKNERERKNYIVNIISIISIKKIIKNIFIVVQNKYSSNKIYWSCRIYNFTKKYIIINNKNNKCFIF